MKIDLRTLIEPVEPKPKPIPLEELMQRFQGPLQNPLASDSGSNPQPNASVQAGRAHLAAYKLRVTGRDLAALGTVLSVADLPIHACLRKLVEDLYGSVGRRTPVDAARAHGLFYGQWNRDRTDQSVLVVPVVALQALRKSVSAVIERPRAHKLLTTGPTLEQVRMLATILTSQGLKTHMQQ